MEYFEDVNLDELFKPKDSQTKFLYEVEEMQFTLIENLVKERKKRNLTQKDISRITGLSQQAVSRIEKYGNSPSLINLIKYLKALNIDINGLF